MEISEEEVVTPTDLILTMRLRCGAIAFRPTGSSKYGVTTRNETARDRLLDGFGDATVHAKAIGIDEMVVSLFNLPAYITDEEIMEKLEGWKVGQQRLVDGKIS